MTKLLSCVGLLFLITLVSAQQTAVKSAAKSSQIEQIDANLLGSWTGHLQYRDFQSDKLVNLPTWLEVTSAADQKSLLFAYTYDDGPSKVVLERSTVTLDIPNRTFTVTSDRDHSSDTFKVIGLDLLSPMGFGNLTLTGSGTENDKPVEVRITLTLSRNQYEYRKETRRPGQEFLFRDGYSFTRRNPPQ
jgi:hypothetical protein